MILPWVFIFPWWAPDLVKGGWVPGEQTASGHGVAITLIISCMPEPWQGRASAGKQLLTEFWPLPLLAFPQDQFASEDFSLGLCPSSVFFSVSLPSATQKIQLRPDPSSPSCLKFWETLNDDGIHGRNQYLCLLAIVGQSTLSCKPPDHNSRQIWNINMELGIHT